MKKLLILIFILPGLSTVSAQNYQIDWYVIGSGGGHSESGSYQIDGTIGQPITGASSSPNYIVESGFWVGTGAQGSLCGPYVVGDYNGSGSSNVADVVDMWSKLKIGTPVYPYLLCECPPGADPWPLRGDVNNSCNMNVSDIVWLFGKLKGQPNVLAPCAACPPGAPAPRGGIKPLVTPDLKAKVKLSSDRKAE